MESDYVRVADTQSRLRNVGYAIAVVIGAFLTGYLLAFVVGQALLLAGFGREDTITLVVLFAAQFTGFGLAVLAFVTIRDERDLFGIHVPTLRDLGWIAIGFVGLLAAALALSVVLSQFGAQTATNQVVTEGQRNPDLFLYLVPISVLFVGPGEELVFRGVVQGLLRRAYGVVPAVLVTSAFFGVAHIFALTGTGKTAYMAIAAAMGIVLGLLYERTENVVVPAAVHGLWNAFLFGSLWLTSTSAIGG
ncbi:MAG: lysostaphin resistance A-like protein [Haloarculaceae archaeon]